MLAGKVKSPFRLIITLCFVVPALRLGVASLEMVVFGLSHDSQSLAFQTTQDNKLSIFIMEPDGTNQEQLRNGQFNDIHPAWSPDGRFIAFSSNQDYQGDVAEITYEIYLVGVDGENPQRLTHSGAYDLYPAWSPDGQLIAFSSDRDGDFDIYVMNSDGSDQHPLTDTNAAESNPSWSPDGRNLTFSSDEQGTFDIYIMDMDAGTQHRLIHLDGMDCGSPDWSPDGDVILFSCYYHNSLYSSLYVMNSDGSDVQQLTDGLTSDTDPAWSPDGTQVAFASTRNGTFDIYVMDVEGREIRRLTYDGGDKPAWWRQL